MADLGEGSRRAEGLAGAAPEAAVKNVVDRFREAYDGRNVDAVLDLFADDGDWRLGPGTFTGKAALRRVLEWDAKLSPVASSRPFGIDTVVCGRVAVTERVVEQAVEGIPYTCPVVTVFEVNAAGRIQHARSYYDKLPILQQVASRHGGVKGWLLRRLVNSLIRASTKGLS